MAVQLSEKGYSIPNVQFCICAEHVLVDVAGY